MLQSTAPTTDRFAYPFAVNGSRHVRSDMRIEGDVSKGLSDWLAGASFRTLLGGESELKDPLKENCWLAAAAAVKSIAARSVPLRLYASDDEEADDEITSEGDAIVKLMRRPNPVQLLTEMIGRSVYHRTNCGEDWWFLAGNDGKAAATSPDGKIETPTQIVQVPGTIVTLDEEDALGFPKTWSYTTNKGQPVKFPHAATLTFLDDSPSKLFRGQGAVETLLRELGSYFQAQRYMEGITRNSGEMSGILLFGDSTSAEQLQAQRTKQDDFTSNPENRGKVQVFGGKEVSWIPNQIAPKDMEFGELFRWVREAICSRLGVPLPLLGILENATYENYRSARRSFWEDTMIPYLRSIETVLNERFFPRLRDVKLQSYRVYFDTDSIEALREDQTEKIVKASQVSVAQAIPINVVLSAMDTDTKIEGGDEAPPQAVGLGVDPLADPDADPAAPTTDANGQPIAGVNTAGTNLTGSDVQSVILNGAQITSALEIVRLVTAGELPRDSGVAMLVEFFGLELARAEAVMGSAGTKTPTTPNPNPVAEAEAAARGDALAGGVSTVTDQPKTDEAKSLVITRKAGGPITERSARVDYWQVHEKAIGEPAERLLRKTAHTYAARYRKAQVARCRQYARHGKSGRTAVAKAFAHDWITREIQDDAQLEQQLRILELNRQEWDAKMIELFAPKLGQVATNALRHAAAELETVSIGVGNPRMVEALSRQAIQLAEGVNGTLAEQVRTKLMETLSGSTSTGDLQSRIREMLPDLEREVGGVISRDSRALNIARTESGKAATTARYEQFKHDGVAQVQWITQGDGEVRDTHRDIDGDVIPIDGTFANGLRYPLDPAGPAEEVCNCRCAYSPVVTP